MVDGSSHTHDDDSTPDTGTIVTALAARAKLRLSPAEHARLSEYVLDSWDMADRLRDVASPGHEGHRDDLPLRTAYSNLPLQPGQRDHRASVGGGSGDLSAAAPEKVAATVLAGDLVSTAGRIAAGEFSPLDLIAAQLDRIERYDTTVRSYITVDRSGALEEAAALSAELVNTGPRSLLHGVPFGAKDSIPAAGMPCTYNSPLTRDWRPQRDCESIRRLRAAGAVLVGKHNLNEFGWSLPAEDDLAPPPRNPWLPEEYSVGSSSGGGAAVAGQLAMFALGTDGGGSARLPAGQHLLFGLKPGHHRAPPQGVSEGSVSEVSVLAREAEDVAAVFAALLIDPDADGARERLRREPAERVEYVGSSPAGLTIAVPTGYVGDVGMEPDVQHAFDATLSAIEALGHRLVRLPATALHILHDAVRANFVVIAAEHYFDHEGPGKDRSRYGKSAGFYNLPGACLSAADYLHAMRLAGLTRQEVDAVLADADMILTPTSPVTRTSTARNPKTHRRGGNAAYTSPFNLTGHPGVSFPVGLSGEGMPIGMQLIGRREGEFDLLRAARALAATFDLPAFPDLDEMAAAVGR